MQGRLSHLADRLLSPHQAFPSALVLSPTRELSSQIYEESRKFAYQTGLRPVVVYGGAPVVHQVCDSTYPRIHPRSDQNGCAWNEVSTSGFESRHQPVARLSAR